MMKKGMMRSLLTIACTIGCVTGCILLYHKKEEQKAILADIGLYIIQEKVEQSEPETTDTSHDSMSEECEELLKEQEVDLQDREEELQLLQLRNDLQNLLEEKESENEDSYIIYEKYFRMKQGELAQIEGMKDLSDCGAWGSINAYLSSVTFNIDDSMFIQYRNTNSSPIWEYLTPRTITITNSVSNMGFMGTLVGMDFVQIQENLYETEILEGFMFHEDGTVYYIQYGDEYYDYIFYSDYEDGRDSWLLIEHTWR